MAKIGETLASIVGPALLRMFPGRELQLFAGNNKFAVFPTLHPDVGEIQIFDDGDEVRVEVGRFTHTHFGPAEEGVTWKADGERIATEVIAFLGDIFDHKVKFYVTARTGGCVPIGSRQSAFSKAISGPHQYFVWSGPLTEYAVTCNTCFPGRARWRKPCCEDPGSRRLTFCT